MLKTDETKKEKKRGKNIEMVLKNSGQKLGQTTTKSGNTVPVTQNWQQNWQKHATCAMCFQRQNPDWNCFCLSPVFTVKNSIIIIIDNAAC